MEMVGRNPTVGQGTYDQDANATEIIRYTSPGWQEKDIEQFKRILLTIEFFRFQAA